MCADLRGLGFLAGATRVCGLGSCLPSRGWNVQLLVNQPASSSSFNRSCILITSFCGGLRRDSLITPPSAAVPEPGGLLATLSGDPAPAGCGDTGVEVVGPGFFGVASSVWPSSKLRGAVGPGEFSIAWRLTLAFMGLLLLLRFSKRREGPSTAFFNAACVRRPCLSYPGMAESNRELRRHHMPRLRHKPAITHQSQAHTRSTPEESARC